MKKYQKRKRPPVKPRPVQSVAPAKTGRDSYDKLALVFTSVAALAAAVSCVIALAGQKSSDQATAAALQKFSQVADAGGRQAAQSERTADATAKQASAAQLQAQAALRQADSATKQAAMSVYQASTSARSATANERAIGLAVQQLDQQRTAEARRFRPIIAIKAIDLKHNAQNAADTKLSLYLENLGPLPAIDTDMKISLNCRANDIQCRKNKNSILSDINYRFGSISGESSQEINESMNRVE